MDNVFIASLLVDLLKEHNRVSLPCLGSFLGHNQSSYRMNDTFYPPYKRIDFFQNEIWNDEKLEKLIARRKQLGLGKAKELLAFWIDEVCLELSSGKEIILPGVGKLFVAFENRLIFEQQLIGNFLLDSYGLEPVQLTPAKGRYNPIPNPELIREIQEKAQAKNHKTVYFIVITILIGITFGVLWLAIFQNNFKDETIPKASLPLSQKEVSNIFRIQTGIFAKYNEARAKARLLEEAGYSPGVYSIEADYSVCIGIFYSQDDAKQMLNHILANDSLQFFSKAKIRQGTIDEESL